MSTRRHSQQPAAVEQLTLFRPRVPERFRIDDETRRRGLRHVARLKAHLEARYPASPRGPGRHTATQSRHDSRAAGRAA